jgi:hypothetical protein
MYGTLFAKKIPPINIEIAFSYTLTNPAGIDHDNLNNSIRFLLFSKHALLEAYQEIKQAIRKVENDHNTPCQIEIIMTGKIEAQIINYNFADLVSFQRVLEEFSIINSNNNKLTY